MKMPLIFSTAFFVLACLTLLIDEVVQSAVYIVGCNVWLAAEYVVIRLGTRHD